MKTILTSMCLFLYLIGNAQNNLIHNASFEDADEGYGTSPCKISQLENTQVWEDDHQFIWTNPVSPCAYYLWCDETNCQPCVAPHSPDWLYADDNTSNMNYHAVATYIEPPVNGSPFGTTHKIQARSGKGYVGMFPGELIEQKFFNSNPLEGGKKYTFSMYVQISRNDFNRWQYKPALNMPIASVLSGFNDNSVLDINVYLGKNKIKYEQEQISCSWNLFNSSMSYNFKDLSTNSIVQLKNFKVSPVDYPYLQWHKLTFEFVCPTNHTYDYVAIEHNYNSDTPGNNGYILIDDVSIIESCQLSCYPTSGFPSPVINSPAINYTVPLQVNNIQNIEKLKMEILPMTGQTPIFSVDFNYTNGIGGSIYWSGETFGGGTAAVGGYICKLTCENECGSFTFSQNIFNAGAVAPYPPVRNLTKIEPREINPCCVIDYTLQNRTFNSAKNFQVKEHIYVNGNVQTTTSGNLELVAGKSIEVTNEFEASSTSLFSAKIVECADAHRMANDVLTNDDFVFHEATGAKSMNKNQAELQKISEALSVLPNPSSGQFVVKSKSPSKDSRNTISIQDIFGKELCSFKDENLSEGFIIDLSKYSKGIYIFRYSDSTGYEQSLKIVKQD